MLNSPTFPDSTAPHLDLLSTQSGASSSDADARPLARAEMMCELGRFADAVTVASQALTADPRNADAWCVMARAQLGSDRANAALKAAEAAGSLAPDSDTAHRLSSEALSRLGREEEAVVAAREATLCAPAGWQGYVRLAQALSVSKRGLKEARVAAEQAISLKPDDPAPHVAAGSVAAADGRKADATAAFCAALAIDPQCGDAHKQLTELQARRRGLRVRVPLPTRRRRAAI
jgi:tetratricopeptide (TPR) repeat protein